jgi:hypothetical protein
LLQAPGHGGTQVGCGAAHWRCCCRGHGHCTWLQACRHAALIQHMAGAVGCGAPSMLRRPLPGEAGARHARRSRTRWVSLPVAWLAAAPAAAAAPCSCDSGCVPGRLSACPAPAQRGRACACQLRIPSALERRGPPAQNTPPPLPSLPLVAPACTRRCAAPEWQPGR